jgi:uncharacterized protein YkwD
VLPAPLPSPTPTAEPTLAPTPTPQPTAVAEPGPDWLRYLNQFRQQSNLPPVIDNQAWSTASYLHSVYMVNTGQLWHDEDMNSPFYTVEGHEAARNSNIAAADISVTSFQWAFNYWISAPFHAVPMLDPELGAVGFGLHRDAKGRTDVAATLDVRRGLGRPPAGVTYPIMFPGNGGQTWVLRYALPEFPGALASCQGYQQPSGPPLILQIGSGQLVPAVSQASLRQDGQPIDFCLFHEGNYYHPDEYTQRSARTILDQRDAIVMIPRRPFAPGSHFEVQIVANGQSYGWSFDSVAPPG